MKTNILLVYHGWRRRPGVAYYLIKNVKNIDRIVNRYKEGGLKDVINTILVGETDCISIEDIEKLVIDEFGADEFDYYFEVDCIAYLGNCYIIDIDGTDDWSE